MKETKDSKITFRITEEEKAYLQKAAENWGVTVSQLIRQILENHIRGDVK